KSLERAEDRKRLEELKSRVVEASENANEVKQANYLVFNRPPNTTKQPWLLDISGRKIVATALGQLSGEMAFDGTTESHARQFTTWSRHRSPERDYFCLLIRPSGIDISIDIREHLE